MTGIKPSPPPSPPPSPQDAKMIEKASDSCLDAIEAIAREKWSALITDDMATKLRANLKNELIKPGVLPKITTNDKELTNFIGKAVKGVVGWAQGTAAMLFVKQSDIDQFKLPLMKLEDTISHPRSPQSQKSDSGKS